MQLRLTLDRIFLESVHLHPHSKASVLASFFCMCLLWESPEPSVTAEDWSSSRGRSWVFILPRSFEYPILQIPPAESKGFRELEDLILPPLTSGVKACVFIPLTWGSQSCLWGEQSRREPFRRSRKAKAVIGKGSVTKEIRNQLCAKDASKHPFPGPVTRRNERWHRKPKRSCGTMAAVGEGWSLAQPSPAHCLGMAQARPSLGGQGGGPTPAAGPVLTGAQVPSSLPASRLELRKHLV